MEIIACIEVRHVAIIDILISWLSLIFMNIIGVLSCRDHLINVLICHIILELLFQRVLRTVHALIIEIAMIVKEHFIAVNIPSRLILIITADGQLDPM